MKSSVTSLYRLISFSEVNTDYLPLTKLLLIVFKNINKFFTFKLFQYTGHILESKDSVQCHCKRLQLELIYKNWCYKEKGVIFC